MAIPAYFDRRNTDIPHGYTCPITLQPMNDPVQIVTGETFERAAITAWFAAHHTNPATGAQLPNKRTATGVEIPDTPDTTLTPNINLRQAIQEYRDLHPRLVTYVYNQQALVERLQQIEHSLCGVCIRKCL